MPTGYTAGIIDGTIKDFKQYAIQCIRAFGAAIHMRDDDIEIPYEPRKVNTYHQERALEAITNKGKLENTSNEQLIEQKKKELEESLQYHETELIKTREIRDKLQKMLDTALIWVSPTEEHDEYKKFMIQQLESTIKHDGDDSYHVKGIADTYIALKNLTADKIRSEKLEMLEYNIEYHTKEWEKEQNRVSDANKWVEDVLNSLK